MRVSTICDIIVVVNCQNAETLFEYINHNWRVYYTAEDLIKSKQGVIL